METYNQTSNDFILIGLFSPLGTGLFLFIFIVLILLMALFGNLSMILLIFLDTHLHTPMYFLLSQLSFIDLNYVSTIVPKMAFNFLFGNKSISFIGCGIQSFFFLTLAVVEALLLTSMAYDRYVAICFPLHYPIRISKRVCVLMITGSWIMGSIKSFHTAYALHFPFCGSRAIDHFFCEVPAMLVLSCVDTTHYERTAYASGVIFLFIPSSLIFASYVQILLTVLQMKSKEARKKSFSTCFFHMIVVIMYYLPFIFTYMRPKKYHTPGQDKFIRNKDVLDAMKNMLRSSFLHKMLQVKSLKYILLSIFIINI
uniref:Olfactory receptor n=1 Tax=Moschus moschiferus TaxID=68415 RepID=A0A8C6CF90_MOSMO